MITGKTNKWAILTSRWGRNAKDLIEAYSQGLMKESEISLLIYDVLPCGALEAANKHNIPSVRLQLQDFHNKEEFQDQIIHKLQEYQIDYILLLSFKYLIRKPMLKAFPYRIINIHPSLFPSFLNTHTAIQDALEYGVRISGITTHIIDEKVDAGIIICQEPIRFDEGETFDTAYPKFSKGGLKILLDTITYIEQKR